MHFFLFNMLLRLYTEKAGAANYSDNSTRDDENPPF